MTAPVSPIATQPFWVVERVLYLDGWEKGRPVYVMNGLRPDDHAYSQDIEHAKQFPTKDDAAAYLRDNLRDNEAFEIHEHMMVAPPTATQETPEQMADWIVERCPLPVNDTIGRGWLRKAVADTVKDALSSAERWIEELVRERDDLLTQKVEYEKMWLGDAERADKAEALVTTLKAEVEELKRERDGAETRYRAEYDIVHRIWKQLGDPNYAELAGRSIYDLIDGLKSRATAAESRLASLTGQVEAVLALYADRESYRDEYGDLPEHDPGAAACEVLAAIRSLPVLPTTGDGGGFVETHGYSSDPRKLRLLLEGRDNFIVDRGLWSEFVDTLPTGRETSGEET